MYPYRLFLDITLYDILVTVGVAAAFAVFLMRKSSDCPKNCKF